MFSRKKTYQAKLWCVNCGSDVRVKLPFGVMPIRADNLVHLYDVHKSAFVDARGLLACQRVCLFCPSCGSYELHRCRWRAANED